MKAANREMDAMMENRLIKVTKVRNTTWSEARVKKALRCQPLYTQKTATEQEIRDEGKAAKYMKIRLVAMDLKRRSRKHPNDVYVGVPGHTVVRLTIAATDLRTHSALPSSGDFFCAFLQADKWPPGVTVDVIFYHPVWRCMVVAEATGPFYGMQVGGKDWKTTVGTDFLVKELGFEESKNQEGAYYHKARDITLALWVDDPWMKCPLDKKTGEALEMHRLHKQLSDKFKMRNFQRLEPGKPLTYIGMRLSAPNDGSGRIMIDSAEYIQELLEGQGMTDCNPVKTPMGRQVLKEAASSPLLIGEDAKRPHRAVMITGLLRWLQSTTCPGIAVATSICKQFDSAPREGCKLLIHQLMRFLKGAQYKAICSNPDSNLGLVTEVDSDHAGEYALTGNTASRTAIKITYKDMLVYWGSFKQVTVADSSGIVELNAMAAGIKQLQGLHIRHIAEELGIIEKGTMLRVYCDSKAALGFSENNGNTTKMNHIDIRKDWVRCVKDSENVDLHKIPTNDNGADHFSKIMERCEYERTGKGNQTELPAEMRYTL